MFEIDHTLRCNDTRGSGQNPERPWGPVSVHRWLSATRSIFQYVESYQLDCNHPISVDGHWGVLMPYSAIGPIRCPMGYKALSLFTGVFYIDRSFRGRLDSTLRLSSPQVHLADEE